MIYIGIDPGLEGAVAILGNEVYGSPYIWDIPIIEVGSGKKTRREYDVNQMISTFKLTTKNTAIIVGLELVHAMPENGVISAHKMGEALGIWKGLLASHFVPFELIPPQRWKKVMMDGMGKEKQASILKAKQLFPTAERFFTHKKHHNRADALLIAEYMRRTRGADKREGE